MAEQSLCDETHRNLLLDSCSKDSSAMGYADTNGALRHDAYGILPNNNVCVSASDCYSASPECANVNNLESFTGRDDNKDDSQDSLESTNSSTSQISEYKVCQSVMQNDSVSAEIPSTSPKDACDSDKTDGAVLRYNSVPDYNNGAIEKNIKVSKSKKNSSTSRGRPRKALVAMYHSQISGDKNTIKIRIKKSNFSTQLTPNKKKSGRRKKHKASDTDVSDHETGGKRSKSTGNDVDTENFEPHEQSGWGAELPPNVLHDVFELLALQEGALPLLVRLSKVCRRWREVALMPSLWRKVDLNWVRERARTDLTLHWMIQNRLSHCQDLNLGEWKVRDIQLTLEAINENCPELKGLNLSGWKGLNADNLKYITTECEKLQRLDLSSINSTSAINAQPLVSLGQTMNSRLTHLVLAHNKIAGFTQIMASIAGNCPNLELLDISNIRTFAHNTALLHIEKMQMGCSKLRVLRITNSQIWLAPASITDQIASPGFPCLEELSLAGIEDDKTTTARCVDDDGIERILKNSTKLRLLDVRGCIRLTDSGLVKVPAWDLEHLFLSACCITRAQNSGMELIVQKWSHSLLEVDLAWSTATSSLDAAVFALAEKGSESPLRTINLCGSSVSLEPVKAILTKCPSLHSINLQSCRALPRGIKRLYTGEAVKELRQSLQDKPKTEKVESDTDQNMDHSSQ